MGLYFAIICSAVEFSTVKEGQVFTFDDGGRIYMKVKEYKVNAHQQGWANAINLSNGEHAMFTPNNLCRLLKNGDKIEVLN